jgi:hypothetical protein
MQVFLGASMTESFVFGLALRFLLFGFSIDFLDLSLLAFHWFCFREGSS